MDLEKDETGQEAPILNMEPVDDLAWKMADRTIDRMRESVEEWADVPFGDLAKLTPGEVLTRIVQEMIFEVERERLYPDDRLDLELGYIRDQAFNRPFPEIE